MRPTTSRNDNIFDFNYSSSSRHVGHFQYRSSSHITEFFGDCDLDYVHDGSTRWARVSEN
jgi:hypothetical protein